MNAEITQPEALRLADQLDARFGGLATVDLAAAELRRQHTALRELALVWPDWRQLVDGFTVNSDWNNEWDAKVRQSMIDWGRKWLASAPASVPAPGEPVAPWRQTGDELAMDPDGWVALDWAPGEDMLSVSISRAGTACFALIAAGERRNGTFEVPPQFFQVLRAAYLAREADPPPPAPTAAPPKGWQTIDSAPKDGTTVDLWCVPSNGAPPGRVPDVGWQAGAWRSPSLFSDGRPGFELDMTPTHWQPLPDPPSAHPQTAGKGSTHHG